MHRPVAKRSKRAGVRLSTQSASAPLSTAPASALQSMSRRGETISGRLASAEPSVPTMKPACTATVSPARPPSPSCHSRERAGRTAEALNQSDSAPSSAADRTASARQRPRAGTRGLLDGVAAPGEAGVEAALGVVEGLVVEIGAAQRGADAAARDGAHRGARADDARTGAGRGAKPRADGAAHEEARDGALRQRAVGIVVGLLLRLQAALVAVAVERLGALALAGQDLMPGHLRAGRGHEDRRRELGGVSEAGTSRARARAARVRHGDGKNTTGRAVD